ncbi:hypothetical protein ALC56_08374 [Trachymyrmex septentrionalis]|uniref:Uncharacterized protein n=1 Tax=Trachymyrmex septentrionalis TaxID=34720 RepID=A0A195FAB2_9HYME|nr:hypothetical protein ALC56_08374 [Trachymyrmex septentrionalis]
MLRLGRAHHYRQRPPDSLGRECLASEATNRRRVERAARILLTGVLEDSAGEAQAASIAGTDNEAR